jgi:hypothetical protein
MILDRFDSPPYTVVVYPANVMISHSWKTFQSGSVRWFRALAVVLRGLHAEVARMESEMVGARRPEREAIAESLSKAKTRIGAIKSVLKVRVFCEVSEGDDGMFLAMPEAPMDGFSGWGDTPMNAVHELKLRIGGEEHFHRVEVVPLVPGMLEELAI